MNIMEFELIRNEEAKEVANETGLDWMDLVDFQSLFDLSRDMLRRRYDEDEIRLHFHNYFWDLAADLQWQAIAWEVEHDEVHVTRCKFAECLEVAYVLQIFCGISIQRKITAAEQIVFPGMTSERRMTNNAGIHNLVYRADQPAAGAAGAADLYVK